MSFEGMTKNPQLEEVKYKISEIQEKLQNVKDGKIKMSTEEIIKAESDLDKLRLKKAQIEKSGGNSPFYKWQPAIDKAKTAISKVSGVIGNITTGTKKVLSGLSKVVSTAGKFFTKVTGISKIMNKISSKTKNIGSGFKQGLKQVTKYIGALFSIRSAYFAIRQASNEWLSSQNSAAEQASTNIEYMKYAMGSVFAPVIEYVIDLFYQLLKAIQSVVYALTGVNIFANASASSYSDMADSAEDASEATKSLAGVHDEINNVSDSSSSSSDSSSSSPSYDLSTLDDEMSSFSEALYNFFEPLVESWKTYGAELVEQLKTTASQVMYLISSVWGSFENIITNGTVYYILENILAIIGDIAEAFANAWNYNGNGDIIIQNMADALNNLLIAIRNVTESTAFQTWLNELLSLFKDISDVLASIDFQPIIDALFTLGSTISLIATDVLLLVVDFLKKVAESSSTVTIINNVSTAFSNLWTAIKNVYYSDDFQTWLSNVGDKLATISQKLADTNWQPLIDAITNIGTSIGDVALGILDGLVTAFTWLAEHPIVAEILTAIAVAIGVLTPIITAFNVIMAATNLTLLPLIGIIAGIIVVIAAIILVIMNWGDIVDWLSEKWNTFKEWISELWDNIKTAISEKIEAIKEWIQEKWEAIKTFLSETMENLKTLIPDTWEAIKTLVSEKIEALKEWISEKWEAIKTSLSQQMEALKTFIPDTWEKIKTLVKEKIENLKTAITDKFNAIKSTISTVINNIKSTITTVWTNIKTKIVDTVTTIKDKVKSAFTTLKTNISTIFTSIKTKITDIWNGIWTAIKNVINKILSGIESFANGIIKGVNKVLSALDGIVSAVGDVIGIDISVPQLSEISLPRLATGNVAYEETLAVFGEYTNASTNPEITAPQSILKETFSDVLSDYASENNQSINLNVYVSEEKLGQIMIDNLRDMKRRSGKNIEALVGN